MYVSCSCFGFIWWEDHIQLWKKLKGTLEGTYPTRSPGGRAVVSACCNFKSTRRGLYCSAETVRRNRWLEVAVWHTKAAFSLLTARVDARQVVSTQLLFSRSWQYAHYMPFSRRMREYKMSDSDEDIVLLLYYNFSAKKRCRKRTIWIHDFIGRRRQYGDWRISHTNTRA